MLCYLGGPFVYDILLVEGYLFFPQHSTLNKMHLLVHIIQTTTTNTTKQTNLTKPTVLNCHDYHRAKIETILLDNYQSFLHPGRRIPCVLQICSLGATPWSSMSHHVLWSTDTGNKLFSQKRFSLPSGTSSVCLQFSLASWSMVNEITLISSINKLGSYNGRYRWKVLSEKQSFQLSKGRSKGRKLCFIEKVLGMCQNIATIFIGAVYSNLI